MRGKSLHQSPLSVSLCSMRFLAPVIAVVALVTNLAAQDLPYKEGNVDAFLHAARANGRPAIVLFNFDAKSG